MYTDTSSYVEIVINQIDCQEHKLYASSNIWKYYIRF